MNQSYKCMRCAEVYSTKSGLTRHQNNKTCLKPSMALKKQLWDTYFTGFWKGQCYGCARTVYADDFNIAYSNDVLAGKPIELQDMRVVCKTCSNQTLAGPTRNSNSEKTSGIIREKILDAVSSTDPSSLYPVSQISVHQSQQTYLMSQDQFLEILRKTHAWKTGFAPMEF